VSAIAEVKEIARDLLTLPVIFRRWPRRSNKPGVCCDQCDKAGRTEPADRIGYHVREMRRGANIAMGSTVIAMTALIVALVGVVIAR
jgi:hypothetical protein